MIQRCQRLVEGLLAFFILLILHLIHSSTLILALILHLFHHFGLSPTTTLSQDVSLWKSKKIPKCLAVVFVPAARGYFSLSQLRYRAWDDGIVYDGMKNDVIDLIKWSLELGVEELLLYDENGIFKHKHHSIQLQSSIKSSFPSSEVHSLSSDSTFLLNDKLRIKLLSREDGKDHLATVTRSIIKGVQGGFVRKEEVDVDYIQEKLYSSLCPEPDLLIVLGGLHLRLRGFPPWHTRLCEIYHDSSLSLLGPPRLRYAAFRRAMDNYAGCQQRFGR